MTLKIRNTNIVVVATGLLSATVACVVAAELSSSTAGSSEPTSAAGVAASDELRKEVGLATARDRARLMHKIYLSTLDVMHERYFHANRAVLPARALEDVFDALEGETRMQTRWISVNTPAMSVSHEPRDDFEKRAAKAIADGRADYENVVAGEYRRAAAVPLGDGCVSCHAGFSQAEPTSPRFAALVVRIPLEVKGGRRE